MFGLHRWASKAEDRLGDGPSPSRGGVPAGAGGPARQRCCDVLTLVTACLLLLVLKYGSFALYLSLGRCAPSTEALFWLSDLARGGGLFGRAALAVVVEPM